LADFLANPTAALTTVLRCHIVPGKIYAEELLQDEEQLLESLDGYELLLSLDEGLTIENAHIIQPDIECRNGIIHVIDMVIIPST